NTFRTATFDWYKEGNRLGEFTDTSAYITAAIWWERIRTSDVNTNRIHRRRAHRVSIRQFLHPVTSDGIECFQDALRGTNLCCCLLTEPFTAGINMALGPGAVAFVFRNHTTTQRRRT